MLENKYNSEDLQDIGFYLRGLLQVMAADNHLHEKEKNKIKKYAESMGFEKEYIEKTIQNLLENKHMPRMPDQFHSKKTAETFLKEAIQMAVCDGILHPLEQKWLLRAAKKNEIDEQYVLNLMEKVLQQDKKL